MKTTNKLWIGIAVMVVLSPLGLILPDHLKAGSAWGEWGSEEVKKMVGYVPEGLSKISMLWNAPIPDYAFKGWEEKGLTQLSFAYIISAAIGIVVTGALMMIIGKILFKKKE